jgi:hypothetical protein
MSLLVELVMEVASAAVVFDSREPLHQSHPGPDVHLTFDPDPPRPGRTGAVQRLDEVADAAAAERSLRPTTTTPPVHRGPDHALIVLCGLTRPGFG